jgi:sugar phosphate isomerase/epimerase
MNRRSFINSSTALAATSLFSGCSALGQSKPKLGFDNFSIRALKLKAPALLEYAAKQKVDAILFSDLDVFENTEENYLAEIKTQAEELEIEIHCGTGSVCPTSHSFKKNKGSAEDQLKKALQVAIALESPVVRCYMGTAKDRQTTGGLRSHMDAMVSTCKTVSSQAREAEVTIAIENHAGDMTARLLKEVIEKAGPDYVGATIDSGNASWTMEAPYKNLEILAPYIASSGIRDSLVFNKKGDIHSTWTAMGKGTVDWPRYFSKWQDTCPEVPVFLEIISGLTKTFPPRSDKKFWSAYQDINTSDYDAFKEMTRKGDRQQTYHTYKNLDRKLLFSAEYMQEQLETSLAYCKNILGLGRKS